MIEDISKMCLLEIEYYIIRTSKHSPKYSGQPHRFFDFCEKNDEYYFKRVWSILHDLSIRTREGEDDNEYLDYLKTKTWHLLKVY